MQRIDQIENDPGSRAGDHAGRTRRASHSPDARFEGGVRYERAATSRETGPSFRPAAADSNHDHELPPHRRRLASGRGADIYGAMPRKRGQTSHAEIAGLFAHASFRALFSGSNPAWSHRQRSAREEYPQLRGARVPLVRRRELEHERANSAASAFRPPTPDYLEVARRECCTPRASPYGGTALANQYLLRALSASAGLAARAPGVKQRPKPRSREA